MTSFVICTPRYMQARERNANNISVGISEGMRQLGRSSRRQEDDNKMNLIKQDGRVWAGFIWLWVGTKGKMLQTR